jgi:chaperonin cofactor prefoldin
MSSTLVISTLLSIVGFVGVLMVKQLIKIADAVQNIDKKLEVLANDHDNLKDDHHELKQRVAKLETA